MPFHSRRQIPSHPKSLAKSHLNLQQISLKKKKKIHPLKFSVAGKDVPQKNPHILLLEEILHHMLFMKPYMKTGMNYHINWWVYRIPSSNSITHACSFPQCPGVWCLLHHAFWAPSHWRLQTWQKAMGKKQHDGISQGFFLVKTQRGFFFFRCFFGWLVWRGVFFSNPSGSFWWKSLDLEGCNCGLFWGGGDKMTSFLGQKP